MSQDKSISKIPSNDELEGFKKHELQAFLKERGVGQTGNKDKGVLLSLAKLYANIPVVISDPEVSLKDTLYIGKYVGLGTEKNPPYKRFRTLND